MKRRKIISMLLGAAMAAAALAGCGNSAGQSSSAGAVDGTESEASAAGETGEVKTINMYTMGIGNTEDYKAVQDAINEISIPEIGVELNWTVLDIGQWFEQYNLLLSGSEAVDLMPNLGGVWTGVQQGAFLELEDLYEQYGQGIAEYYDEEYMHAGYINGHLYGIAGQKDFAATKNITYRKDIVDELGLDVSNVKTLDDWTPILAAVKEAYPDMYGFVSNGGNSLQQFDTYNWDNLGDDLGVLVDYAQDPTVVNLYESDTYIDLLHTMREWYEAGYVSPDTATASENYGDVIKADKAFCSITTGNPGIENEASLNTGHEMASIALTDPLASTGNVTAVMWSIPYASAEPEAAMKFLNLMYTSPEVSALLNYGIEGTHCQLGDDGCYYYLDGQDASSCTYHPEMTWIWPNTYICPSWRGATGDLGTKMTEFNRSAIKSVAMGFTFDNTSVVNEVTACANVVQQYAYGLEVGAVDVDTVLPEFQQALKDAGIEKIIEEKQAQLDAWLAEQQ